MNVDVMEQKQFNDFWEIRCPECNEPIDLEILVNLLEKRMKVKRITTRKKKSK